MTSDRFEMLNALSPAEAARVILKGCYYAHEYEIAIDKADELATNLIAGGFEALADHWMAIGNCLSEYYHAE